MRVQEVERRMTGRFSDGTITVYPGPGGELVTIAHYWTDLLGLRRKYERSHLEEIYRTHAPGGCVDGWLTLRPRPGPDQTRGSGPGQFRRWSAVKV